MQSDGREKLRGSFGCRRSLMAASLALLSRRGSRSGGPWRQVERWQAERENGVSTKIMKAICAREPCND